MLLSRPKVSPLDWGTVPVALRAPVGAFPVPVYGGWHAYAVAALVDLGRFGAVARTPVDASRRVTRECLPEVPGALELVRRDWSEEEIEETRNDVLEILASAGVSAPDYDLLGWDWWIVPPHGMSSDRFLDLIAPYMIAAHDHLIGRRLYRQYRTELELRYRGRDRLGA